MPVPFHWVCCKWFQAQLELGTIFWLPPTHCSDAYSSLECQEDSKKQKAKGRNEAEQVTHLASVTHRPRIPGCHFRSSVIPRQIPPLPQSRGTRKSGPAYTYPAPEPTTPHGPDLCSLGKEEGISLHSPLQVLDCGTGNGMVLGGNWADSDLGADCLAVFSCGAPPSVIGRADSRGQPHIICQALDTANHIRH